MTVLQVVHVHHGQGARPHDPRAVQFAAPAQHLAEPQIIRRRAGQTAAAGIEARSLTIGAGLRIIDQLEGLVLIAAVVGRQPVMLFRRDMEAGIDHAQGIEDGLLQILREGLAGDDLDEGPADVGGEGIHPFLAGLIDQRGLAELVHKAHHIVIAAKAADLQATIDMVDRVLNADAGQAAAIGQTACMAQHVTDADGAIQRLGLHGLAFARHIDPLIGPRGHKPRDRIIELEQTLLKQAHQRNRGNGLGHGIDAEDGVVCHRLTGGQIHVPKTTEEGLMPMARHRHLTARDPALINIFALEMVADTL